MSEPQSDRTQQIALFRYGLIADLIHLPPGDRTLGKRLAEKADRVYHIPHSNRCRVASETLRHWLKRYRKGGFDALLPKPRKDAGSSHALPQHVVDLLCELKEQKPKLSVQLLIKQAIASGNVPEGLPLPPSTVHRLLSRQGLMRKREHESDADRRRFAFEHAGDLWMSDVMHGPAVFVGKHKRKTYLIAFIDDATRVIPYAAFALAESTAVFIPVLKQAILRRGIPKRLYVDNGSAFRSQHLQLVCARLGITLIHARPYRPQGKGKQERWFRTVRMQLLTRLAPEDQASLDALNRRLWAWVEGEYHRTPHHGLEGSSPLDAWAERGAHVEHVGQRPDIEDMFLFEEKRKVHKDRTVSLHGVAYEVDATLVGTTVTLRFDPQRPNSTVQIFADGKRCEDAKPVDVHANCFVKRERPKRDAEFELPVSTLRLSELDTKEGR